MRGLFVSFQGFLERSNGGVQLCTREYIDVIEGAGIELTPIPFPVDRRPLKRLRRLVDSSAHYRFSQREIVDRIVAAARQVAPTFVFLNQATLAPIAASIRKRLNGSCKIVLLSHGLESTDLLHFIRLRNVLPLSGRVRPTAAMALGRALLMEMNSRSAVDLVCVLSPFDAQLEAWLGSTRVCWLPRRVISAPVTWRPQAGRLGWVGTLDHSPNLDGLVTMLDALQARHSQAMRVRVVGSPERTGKWLVDRYAAVDYLGALDSAALNAEASTWLAFINPIFCQARGCSTKLATPLGWHIPIVTTKVGRRGYVWSEGGVIEADTPAAFVESCFELLDPDRVQHARENVIKAAETAPGTGDISKKFLAALAMKDMPSENETTPSASNVEIHLSAAVTP